MISLNELLSGNKLEDLTEDQKDNLNKLLDVMNQLRTIWARPMTITSGVRSMKQHLAIYAKKGITNPAKIPMKSNHLFGNAADVADPKLELTAFLKDNPSIMDELDIYCEEGNTNWVHVQIVPFKSYKPGGTRWFNP